MSRKYPAGGILEDASNAWCSMPKPIFIAHAGGGSLCKYSNSKEAIADSIARGYKIIEIDVDLTSDCIPVLSHRFRPNNEVVFDYRPSLSEFLSTPICGRFTPMTLSQCFTTFKDFDGFWAIDSWGVYRSGMAFDLPRYLVENLLEGQVRNVIYLANSLQEAIELAKSGLFASVHCGLPEDIDTSNGIWQLPYLVRIYIGAGIRSVTLMDREISDLTKQVVATLRKSGIKVSICGVETCERARTWIEVGADCFNTDALSPHQMRFEK